MSNQRENLKEFKPEEIEALIEREGLPKYRAKQLLGWIYKRHASSLTEITEYPKSLRETLSERYFIGNLCLIQRSIGSCGTEKFLWLLEDGQTIESVLIPDGERLTLCISSQVGCALRCKFCLTGKIGFIRNLKAWEIVDQFIQVSRILKQESRRITNIVFMGMGEPLLNLENVVEAIRRFKNLIEFSPRRITLSTVGIIPALAQFSKIEQAVKLAISLNAPTDEIRSFLMPINKTYPLHELLNQLRRYPLRARHRITFEYVLLRDINSSERDALRVAEILRGIPSKINLIPFNPWSGCEFERPKEEQVLRFQQILISKGYSVFIRKSKGSDILAACGQLKANYSFTCSS